MVLFYVEGIVLYLQKVGSSILTYLKLAAGWMTHKKLMEWKM